LPPNFGPLRGSGVNLYCKSCFLTTLPTGICFLSLTSSGLLHATALAHWMRSVSNVLVVLSGSRCVNASQVALHLALRSTLVDLTRLANIELSNIGCKFSWCILPMIVHLQKCRTIVYLPSLLKRHFSTRLKIVLGPLKLSLESHVGKLVALA
jgi:hypothetical protein